MLAVDKIIHILYYNYSIVIQYTIFYERLLFMKMTRKVISVALALIMALSMFAICASAENATALKAGANALQSGDYSYTALVEGLYAISIDCEAEDDFEYTIEYADFYESYSVVDDYSTALYYFESGDTFAFSVETECPSLNMNIEYKGTVVALTPNALGLQLNYDVEEYEDMLDGGSTFYSYTFYQCVNLTTLLGATYTLDCFTVNSDKQLKSGLNTLTVTGFGADKTLLFNLYKASDYVQGVEFKDTDKFTAKFDIYGGLNYDSLTYPEAITVNTKNGAVEAAYDDEIGYYTFKCNDGYTVYLAGDYVVNEDYTVDFVVADGYSFDTIFAKEAVELDSLSVLFGKIAQIRDLFESILFVFQSFVSSIISIFA